MAQLTDPTSLYRLFDADGQLLYIGIALDTVRRLDEHANDKPWWGEVATVTLEHYPGRVEAQEAERAAIQDEHPAYNICHMAGRGFRAWLLLQTLRRDPVGALARDVRADPDFPRFGTLDDFLAHVGYGDAAPTVERAWAEWSRP